jgi:hypothetical protein
MEAFRKLPPAELARRQAEGMQAWQAWAVQHQASIVGMGGPLGKTKRISPAGIEDIHNNMGAYTVVQAESHEAAAKLFVGHPHFTIFPGDGIEVMEVLPIPQQ